MCGGSLKVRRSQLNSGAGRVAALRSICRLPDFRPTGLPILRTTGRPLYHLPVDAIGTCSIRLGPASIAFDDLIEQPDQQSPLAGIEACQHIGLARNEAADDSLVEVLPGVGQVQHPATAVRDIGFARNQLLFLQLLYRACYAGFGAARNAAYLLRVQPRLSREAK